MAYSTDKCVMIYTANGREFIRKDWLDRIGDIIAHLMVTEKEFNLVSLKRENW